MTLFDYVNDEKLAVFRACGFNWDEHRYINIFRWRNHTRRGFRKT